MNLKHLIKKKIEKKIKKYFKIIPEYKQEVRFNYYKSLGINFNKVLDIGAYLGTLERNVWKNISWFKYINDWVQIHKKKKF